MLRKLKYWLAMLDYKFGKHPTYNSWAAKWEYELE